MQDYQKQIEACQLQLQESEARNEVLDKQVCEEYKIDEELKWVFMRLSSWIFILSSFFSLKGF